MSSTSDAIASLRAVYAQRYAAARAAHARSRHVIGYSDPLVPVEYLMAAAAAPVLVMAEVPHATPDADVLIERREPWSMRSVAERALDGTLAFLDLLVVGHRDEWLYYNLKEAVRIGAGSRVPPLLLCDVIADESDSVDAYNAVQLDYLKDAVQRVGGVAIDAAALRAAVVLTNQRRALQRQLVALRDDGRLTGVLAMELLGAAFFMDCVDYCRALQRALEALTQASRLDGPRVLLLSAQTLYHTRLHAALESAGALVVAEDLWCGSRAAAPDIDDAGDVFAAVRRAYVRDIQHEDLQPRERRESWFRQRLVRGDLAGVALHLPPEDRQFGWNLPGIQRQVEAEGLKFAVLPAALTPERRDADTSIATFVRDLQ